MIPTRMFKPTLLLLFLAVTASACASSGRVRDSRPGNDDDPITAEDLEQELAGDLYTVVQRLRPRWTRARGSQTFVGSVQVSLIVDGVPWANNLSRLQEIRVGDVEEVRYMSAPDATTMYGPDMAGGAILVFMKRGG